MYIFWYMQAAQHGLLNCFVGYCCHFKGNLYRFFFLMLIFLYAHGCVHILMYACIYV